MRISVFYGVPGTEGGVCAVINMFCYIEKGCCKMMISLFCNGLFFSFFVMSPAGCYHNKSIFFPHPQFFPEHFHPLILYQLVLCKLYFSTFNVGNYTIQISHIRL